jgi:hypothetical protein
LDNDILDKITAGKVKERSVNTISLEDLKKRWDDQGSIPPSEIPALVDTLSKKQPYLLAYLMASGNDIFNEDEREALLFMGVMIWKIAEDSKSLPRISGNLLEKWEKKNIEMMEYLAGEPESEFTDTVEKIMETYSQSELLRFIIEKLMEEPEKGVELREDTIGMIVLYLKTIIDCIDTVQKKAK